MSNQSKIGTIGWIDLTIKDCPQIRDFYQTVVGWKHEPVDMDGYADFSMIPPEGTEPVAGICHARRGNEAFPPQWLIYITVADINASIAKCLELGGKLIIEPLNLGSYGYICVIQDPAGAVCALQSEVGGSQ